MQDRKETTVRRRKLDSLREDGEAYPNDFKRQHVAAELQQAFSAASQEELASNSHETAVAGRVLLKRELGKASFLTIKDRSGKIQCYLRQDSLGAETYEQFVNLCDIGDIVGVRGHLMRTQKGELTVHGSDFRILVKSLQPFPEKFHGLEDQEIRYRQRYVDVMVNDESRRVFEKRSQILQLLRHFFDSRGYMEVETPMMHAIPGGATAKPFITRHNSLNMDLYLRVAPELYLKRLVIGGWERVYEINRNFRNEGLSTRHNPEFTMLEFYQAYSTYEDLIKLTTTLMSELAEQVLGAKDFSYGDHQISLSDEPHAIRMIDSVADAFGIPRTDRLYEKKYLQELAASRAITFSQDMTWGTMLNELFESLVQPTLIQPTFVVEYPTEISPLAKRSVNNECVTDRFEYFIAGQEIANGFSELNDPDDQESRFRSQVEQAKLGDEEAMRFDQDFITALQYGLPPTAGEGIGIDRLVMLLTNRTSIRDVLLFPQLRPKAQ
ncbi:MAG: lysine--tRNA ligase [Gammaproteobacteria bacterium]|nr:lysine--tRNA ligase [Gammaproteobacteria bacterium]